MKRFVVLCLILLSVFSLSACKKETPLPEKGDPLTFTGKILSIDEELESMFVEAEGQEFTKAVISLHSDTELLDGKENKLELSDFKIDDSVTITNFGLITDQYPVQMSAKKIVKN